MRQHGTEHRKLTELQAAKRNNYYYGKMLDVAQCTMEQQYLLASQWQLNRLIFGSGVVTGLHVPQAVLRAA